MTVAIHPADRNRENRSHFTEYCEVSRWCVPYYLSPKAENTLQGRKTCPEDVAKVDEIRTHLGQDFSDSAT